MMRLQFESFNKIYYSILKGSGDKFRAKKGITLLFNSLNNFKVGIIYGLIVDGFKLGS